MLVSTSPAAADAESDDSTVDLTFTFQGRTVTCQLEARTQHEYVPESDQTEMSASTFVRGTDSLCGSLEAGGGIASTAVAVEYVQPGEPRPERLYSEVGGRATYLTHTANGAVSSLVGTHTVYHACDNPPEGHIFCEATTQTNPK